MFRTNDAVAVTYKNLSTAALCATVLTSSAAVVSPGGKEDVSLENKREISPLLIFEKIPLSWRS